MADPDIVEILQRWTYLNFISLLFPWSQESKSTKNTSLNRESLMIEWIWPLAFLLLPLPWPVRRFLREAKQERPALLVPSLGPFIGGSKEEVAEWKYMNLKIATLVDMGLTNCGPGASPMDRRSHYYANYRKGSNACSRHFRKHGDRRYGYKRGIRGSFNCRKTGCLRFRVPTRRG